MTLTLIRRLQSHRGFTVLCYDLLRRRHSLSKSNLIASRDSWSVTRPLLESLTDEKLANAANQATQHDKHDNTDTVEGRDVRRLGSLLWPSRISWQRTSSYSSHGIYP